MKKLSILIAVCCILFIGCANKKQLTDSTSPEIFLNGTWELDYVSGPRIAFEGLYPERKPTLIFDVENKKVTGNTSCNTLNAPLVIDGNKIDFKGPIATTKMFCPGEGERIFLETLKKVNTYNISDSTLTFIMGDIAIMRFKKK